MQAYSNGEPIPNATGTDSDYVYRIEDLMAGLGYDPATVHYQLEDMIAWKIREANEDVAEWHRRNIGNLTGSVLEGKFAAGEPMDAEEQAQHQSMRDNYNAKRALVARIRAERNGGTWKTARDLSRFVAV